MTWEEIKSHRQWDQQYFYIILRSEADEGMIEAFNEAKETFAKTKTYPRIHTYFLEPPDGKEPDSRVLRFKDMLRNEMEHYYSESPNISEVKLSMMFELTGNLDGAGRVTVENGMICLNGRELMPVQEIPAYAFNKKLKITKEELAALKERRVQLSARFKTDPENRELEHELSETADRIRELKEENHEIENDILSLFSTIAEIKSSGDPITWRGKKAEEYLKQGRYEEALQVLRDENREEELEHAVMLTRTGKEAAEAYINEDWLKIRILMTQGILKKSLDEIYSCYEKCAELIQTELILPPDILIDYLKFLQKQKNHRKGIEYGEWLRDYYKLKRKETVSEAEVLNFLGSFYQDAHRTEEAQENFIKALKIRKELAGPKPAFYDNVFLARSYNYIALLYHDKKNYEEAEKYHREALEIRRELAKADPSRYERDLGSTYNNLGNIYKDLKQYEEAEKYFLEALSIREKLAKDGSEDLIGELASTYNNLGNLYFFNKKEKKEKAEEYYSEALKIREKLAAENPEANEPDLAKTYHNLGNLYKDMKRWPEAEECCEKALVIREKLAERNPYQKKDLEKTQKLLEVIEKKLADK